MAHARFTSLILILSCATATSALAQPVRQSFMPQGDMADAPAGFTAMCERDRDLCLLGQSPDTQIAAPVVQANFTTKASATARSALLEATGAVAFQPGSAPTQAAPARIEQSAAWPMLEQNDDLRLLIKAVNKKVNRHVTQMTDFAAMGIGEYWQRLPAPLPVGDCEDIAIEKRIRLTEAGFPAERLFYGIAFVRNIGLHTVLIARMDDGDYVLDSLTPRIVRWEDAHYTWLRKQVPGSPLLWERIDGGAPITTMAAVDAGAAPPAS